MRGNLVKEAEVMSTRKEMSNAYKERKPCGGVYTITNTVNGRYLLGHAANIKSVEQRFQFAITTGSTIHPRLQKDWDEFGAQAFKLEVLEELEQHPTQSQAEFLDDLEML